MFSSFLTFTASDGDGHRVVLGDSTAGSVVSFRSGVPNNFKLVIYIEYYRSVCGMFPKLQDVYYRVSYIFLKRKRWISQS